ncbi:MAG: hypothetical protein RL662_674 [Bacteroidota bacterium]|jgi:hypothetical protein
MAITDFFKKIRTGKLFFGKKEPNFVVEFILKGKTYVVEEFDLEFKQDVNVKNKPDGEPYGGIITITISDTPDDWINHWMINAREKNDGEFRFLSNEGRIVGGARLSILFKDAYCIAYNTWVNTQGAGLLTTLVISPRKVYIGNEELENKWKY